MATTWNDWYRILLALVMWREARGEDTSGLGMRAVGHVIRNRVRGGFGDWDHVITGKWQFSSMTAPKDSQLVVWPDSPNAAFALAMVISDGIFEGSDPDVTSGATNYFNPDATPPESSFWATVANNDQYEQCAKIGHHTFYRKKQTAYALDPGGEIGT